MSRRVVVAVLAGGAAVLLATVTGLLVLEAYLLWSGQAPITWFTECAVSAYPLPAFLVVGVVTAGVGLLLGHFFWSRTLRS